MKLIKQQKGMATVEVILIVIILGIVGFVGYYVMQKNKSTPTTSSSTSTTNSKTTATLEEIVKNINQIIPAQYSFAKVSDIGNHSQAGVSYRIEGYDYVTEAQNENTGTLFKSDISTDLDKEFQQFLPVGDAIGKELAKAGFTLDNDPAQKPYNDSLNRTQYYINSESVCSIHVNTGATGLDCVPKSKLIDAAKAAKPLVEAYQKHNSDIKLKDLRVSTPDIKISKTAGYRFAQMGVGDVNGAGSAALFYEKNGTWVFFKSTQMILPCSDFQSDLDIKKAFLGESCEDPATNTQNTVQ